MPDDVLLGADLGTSGLKLVALDHAGRVVAEAERGYPVDRPRSRPRGDRRARPGGRRFDEALSAVAPRAARRPGARAGPVRARCTAPSSWTPPGGRCGRRCCGPTRRAAAELDLWRALPGADRAALANPLVAGDDRPACSPGWPGTSRRRCGRPPPCCCPRTRSGPRCCPDRPPGSPTAATPRRRCSGTSPPTTGRRRRSPPPASTRCCCRPCARPARSLGTAALPVGEVPVVTGGADTPLALLAAGTPVAQLNLGTGAQLLAPGLGAAGRSPIRSCTATPTSRAAGTPWRRCRTAARRGSGCAACSGMSWAELFDAAAAAPAGAGGVAFRPFLTGERGRRRPARPTGAAGAACTRARPARTWRARPSRGSCSRSAPRSRCSTVPDGGRAGRAHRRRGAGAAGPAAAGRRAGPSGAAPAAAQRLGDRGGHAGRARGRGRRRPGAPDRRGARPAGRRRAAQARRTAGRGPSGQAASGPAGAVGRTRSEGGVVQEAVGRQRAPAARAGRAGEVGEPAAGLPDDHVERGEVPQRDLGLAGDVDRALGQQAVAPEVAVGAGAPDRPGEVEEAVEQAALLPAGEAGVGQARVVAASLTCETRQRVADSSRRPVHAPTSFAAHQRLFSAGAETRPTTGSSPSNSEISVAHTGTPRTKFLVPSIGSSTQRRGPWPGRRRTPRP